MLNRLTAPRGQGLAIGILLAILLLATTGVAARQQAASISLSPTSGLAGTTVTIQGTGWAATTGEIHWDDASYALLGTFQANANGAFSTMITIPSNATTGTHTVQACQYCRSIVRAPIMASAQFTVTQLQRPTQVIVLPTPQRLPTECDPRGVAGEVVVDFESFPVGTRLDGTTLPERITFLGEDALVVFDPVVRTNSESRALMNDFAGREFGSINIPIRFRLEGAADFVGVFVGLNEQIWAEEPITATLTAFGFGADGHRIELGSDTQMFGPGPTPIQICLAVEAPGQILEATINYTGAGGVAEPEVIDDLVVRGPERPVPTPIDDLPPVVTIETPEDGALITDRYPRLQGQVTEDRELSRLEVWLNGSLYREIGASPAGYAPSGDRLYLFALDPLPTASMLPCSPNSIEVRAYDSSYNRGSDVASVELLIGDLAVVSAEPVQVVYGGPLVRGKATAFRVRVNSTFRCEVDSWFRLALPESDWSTLPPATGRWAPAIATGMEYPSLWGPVPIPANAVDFAVMLPYIPPADEATGWGGTVDPAGIIEGREADGVYGPDVRVAPRPIGSSAQFTVAIDPGNDIPETDETNNQIASDVLEVHDTRGVHFYFVPWLFNASPQPGETESDYEFYLRESGYTDVASRLETVRRSMWGGAVPLRLALTPQDIDRLHREATRYIEYFLGSFPIADSEISFEFGSSMYFEDEYLASRDSNPCDGGDFIRGLNDTVVSAHPDVDIVILFRVMGCCGQSPGVYFDAGLELVGSPPNWHHLVVNPDLDPGDDDYTCWDWTFPLEGAAEYTIAHELSHYLLGMPGECYACSAPDHQDVDCAYCNSDVDGFWVNRWLEFPRGTDYFMEGVCDVCPAWNRLEPSRKRNGTLNPDGYRHAVEMFAEGGDPTVLMVRGEIRRNGEVALEPFLVLENGVVDLHQGADGQYSIVLIGPDDQILSRWGFDPRFTVFGPPPSLPVELDLASLSYRVEWQAGTRRIEIRDREGNVLASREVSASAPEVHIVQPNGGEAWRAGREVTIRWEASDLDGDALTYALAVTPDGGQTWIPLDIELTETEYVWHTGGLLDGSQYVVRVTATDGVNTSADLSDTAFSIRPALALPLPAWTLAAIGILVVVGVGLIGYAAFSALRGSRKK